MRPRVELAALVCSGCGSPVRDQYKFAGWKHRSWRDSSIPEYGRDFGREIEFLLKAGLIRFVVELIDNESRIIHPLARGDGDLEERKLTGRRPTARVKKDRHTCGSATASGPFELGLLGSSLPDACAAPRDASKTCGRY